MSVSQGFIDEKEQPPYGTTSPVKTKAGPQSEVYEWKELETRAGKMAYWVKKLGLSPSLRIWVQSLDLPWRKQRTYSGKLSSVLHMTPCYECGYVWWGPFLPAPIHCPIVYFWIFHLVFSYCKLLTWQSSSWDTETCGRWWLPCLSSMYGEAPGSFSAHLSNSVPHSGSSTHFQKPIWSPHCITSSVSSFTPQACAHQTHAHVGSLHLWFSQLSCYPLSNAYELVSFHINVCLSTSQAQVWIFHVTVMVFSQEPCPVNHCLKNPPFFSKRIVLYMSLGVLGPHVH